MKKTLLLAAAALLGFSASAAVLEEGKPYLVKHVETGFYMNMEIDGRGDNKGRHCASVESEENASRIYFVQNPEVTSQWQIRLNSPDGKNLSSNADWNSIINSTDGYYWNVTKYTGEDGSTSYTFARTANASNNQNNYLGPNSIDWQDNPVTIRVTDAIYSNQDGSNATKLANCKWELVADSRDDAAFLAEKRAQLSDAIEANFAKYFLDKTPGYYSTTSDAATTYREGELADLIALSKDESATLADIEAALTEISSVKPSISASNATFEGVSGIFKIVNVEGTGSRGYLYDRNAEDNYAYSSERENNKRPSELDVANDYWSIIPVEGGYAIYNVGTKKFLKAPATGGANSGWKVLADGASLISVAPSSKGGYPTLEISSGNIHMSISNGYVGGVTAYYAADDGGVPFRFERVGDANTSLDAEMTELYKKVVIPNAAKARYAELVGVPYPNASGISVPGYVPASNEKILALATALAGTDITAISSALSALASAPANDPWAYTEGALYTIASVESAARGYLQVTEDGKVTTTICTGETLDAADPKFQFGIAEIDGKTYIYSKYAQKFLNAFGPHSDYTWDGPKNYTDFTWQLSENPTPVSAVIYKGAIPHSVAVQGGLRPSKMKGNNKSTIGGITIFGKEADGLYGNVCVANGINDQVDGNGLYFSYAGKDADVAAVEAIATAAIDAVAKQVEAANLPGEDNPVVNHYHPVVVGQLVSETTTPDHKAHLLANGERTAIESGHVYTLVDAEGKAYGVDTDGNQINAEFADGKNFRWVVTTATPAESEISLLADENAPKYVLTHKHDDSTVTLTIDGATEHAIENGDLGKVQLGGKAYTMTHVSANAEDASTSAINEIVAEGAASKVIYDLQGRRVNNASKGIFIVNGKKVLVK